MSKSYGPRISIQHHGNSVFALLFEGSIYIYPSLAEAIAAANGWKELPEPSQEDKDYYWEKADVHPWFDVSPEDIAAHQPVGLLNSPILTAEGVFEYHAITPSEAAAIVANSPWESFIGHTSTASAFSAVIGQNVPARTENPRPEFKQRVLQRALVMKINGRLPEGKVLTIDEMDKVGYSFGLLTRTS